MWANFTAPFSFDRRPRQAIAFVVQPGVRNLPRDVAEAAIAEGKAVAVKAPQKQTKQPAA